ncbi:(2Fe-2S)-binding protein [Streptomyces himalayensis]|uniref:(2Fe-2S)-binding protein n=1 Tax=Streptomyces himalayensis subsp. himalayensis TaxID=2756131 RepID=A0A7W0DTX5_9ACTN|nr:(2Fe-2S)-binding protein [Streptomyces himalayensis]MBA2951203.1 (2Fe-2S)-binding protein [Streptomyces himalayensis subsp. himalayensis]
MTTSTAAKYGTARRAVTVRVNGRHVTREVSTRTTLADFLRDELDLVSVHVGCEHGECGCCTVLFDGLSVRSCLMLAVQADGHAVETVESLSANPAELHPIQEAFAEEQGLQCGFCTPAMLLRTKEIIDAGREMTDAEVRHEISGILCRCTGYQNIVNAVQSAGAKLRGPTAGGRD